MTTFVQDTTLKLNQEQEKLRELIENTNQHVFITGKAGTGKSTLLQELKNSSSKELVVVAPTGVAALNIGGQTIHSFFKIKPTGFIDKKQLKVSQESKKLFNKINTVIIDEISMVRADLMDAIDFILKQARQCSEPFGGAQIIMFGDLYQLPPVVADKSLEQYLREVYGGFYFFNANVWSEADLEIHELKENMRQKDEEFREILDAIRIREFDTALLNSLNERAQVQPPNNDFITLALTNSSVQAINLEKLNALHTKKHEYKAKIEGHLEPSAYPTEQKLELKQGAQVMFLKNDREGRWVNGSIGTIFSLSRSEVEVELDGEIYVIKPEKWDKIRYSIDSDSNKITEETVSSFKQFPLRLAWAITVHKSQGQTLDRVVLDMGRGAFAHGQTYVALSRCRKLDQLYLKREIRARDIIIDPQVSDFMRKVSKN